MSNCNLEIDQDRVFDTIDMFEKHRQVMFHQQRNIYTCLSHRIAGRTVLEAGCGMGLGTAILERNAKSIVGTDKLQRNVDFAHCLYPWIDFRVWDLNQPFPSKMKADVAVAIEAVEHVRDTQAAIAHLLMTASEEVIISVPNGAGKPRPPENPYHVCEYTPAEMLDTISSVCTGGETTTVHEWVSWSQVDTRTTADPLIYRIRR